METQNYEKCTEVRATFSSVITVSNDIDIRVYLRRTVGEGDIPKFPQAQSVCKAELWLQRVAELWLQTVAELWLQTVAELWLQTVAELWLQTVAELWLQTVAELWLQTVAELWLQISSSKSFNLISTFFPILFQ
jgi:hypothetical protein